MEKFTKKNRDMEKNQKTHSILQRNLSELETKIKSMVEEGGDMESVDEIERNLGFVKNHVAAEFSSPDDTLSHPFHRRLDDIQSAVAGLKIINFSDQATGDVELEFDVDNGAGEVDATSSITDPFSNFVNPLFDKLQSLEVEQDLKEQEEDEEVRMLVGASPANAG